MNRIQIRACVVIVLLAFLCACARSPEARRDKYLARGKALLQKHEYSRAILEFRNAAKAMPKDAEAYYQIGVASEDAGDVRTAIPFFKKALDQNPKHAGAQLKLAQLMALTNNKTLLQDAESSLNALKQSSPASPDVLNSLALTELKLGKPDDAATDLGEVLAKAPQELRSSVLLAQTKLWQHDTRGAEEVLLKACQAAPKSADPRVALGELYLAEKKTGEAQAEFQHALAIDPKNGSALLHIGNLQRALGQNQEAEQTFKRLSASDQELYKPVYAQFLFAEGKRDEAVREFERLAKENPGDRMARTRLIAAYQAVNRTADAEKVLDEALKKNPKDLDALLQRAEIFVSLRKYAQADADLGEVIHLRPNSAEAHYVRAKLYKAWGQNLTYRQELSEALRLDPTLVPVRLELAQSFISDKQAPAALETLNAAPADQKQLTPVIVERNWALWAAGEMAEMRKGIDQALARGRSADLLLQDGVWKLKSGNPSGARASLEEALKMNPADVRALSAMSESYVVEKQDAMGIEKVKEYASKQPRSAAMQEFLGTTLLTHKDNEHARAAFEAAKAADPHFVDADLSLVQVDLVEGKTDDARKRLEAVLSADTGNKTASQWLANVETMKGDYDAAIKQYQKIVAASPDDAQALNNLAYLLAGQNKEPDVALKMAQRAVELSPDDPSFLDTLGWILYQKTLYSSAIPYLERAAAKGNSAQLKFHLAMAYAKAGDAKRGRVALEGALKQNPNMPEAKAAQEMLEHSK